MSFFERIRAALMRFMYGRYGSDPLGRAIIYTSLALLLLTFLTGFPLFYYASIFGYGWALFRMFSTRIERRKQENEVYLAKTVNLRRELRQALVRFRNRKQYKYFKCPKCGVRLRLTRGIGDKTITCRNCGHSFKKKA